MNSIRVLNRIVASIASAVLLVGVAAGVATPAQAAACKGSNSHRVAAVDPVTGGATELVSIDSCKAKNLVAAYSKVKEATGLAATLGSAWWPTGAAGTLLYVWAYGNQAAVKKCAKAGTGITYKQFNGIVTTCSAQ